MIDSLQITNIKAHLDSYLQFSPGLNVITGDTNAGKSSIFKILTWTLKNSPRGYNPKSWKKLKASSTSPTSTIKFTDGNVITRGRGTNGNSLTLNGKIYAALQGKMPDMAATVVNMGDANFQPQEEAFFLVADTGGEAAKKINKIANLEGMGEVISLVKTRVKEAKRREDKHGVKIASLKKQLDDMLWLADAELDIADLEERGEVLLDRGRQRDCIARNIADCEHIHKELSALPPYSCIIKLNKLKISGQELANREAKAESIANLIVNIATYKRNIEKLNSTTVVIADKLRILHTRVANFEKQQNKAASIKLLLQELSGINRDIEKCQVIDEKMLGSLISRSNAAQISRNKYQEISVILTKIAELKSGINHECNSIKELTNGLTELKKDNPICPVCGGPLI